MTVPVARADLEQLLYLLSGDIERRARHGHPIPTRLRQLRHRLARVLSDSGHDQCQTISATAQFETTTERAKRLNVTTRTIRRRAQRDGASRYGNTWIFTTTEGNSC